jgi:hypothetical protein
MEVAISRWQAKGAARNSPIDPPNEPRQSAVGCSSNVVPTLSFRLLYGLLILSYGRRQILWLAVTTHPTAEWMAQQLIEACGWEWTPNYIVRDRDSVYGEVFTRRLRAMGIRDRPTAPRSPWQNGHTERLIGSIRRECLDYVVVFGERHLRHLLISYMAYYNGARTHLSLNKDAPVPRVVQAIGRILPAPILGGLHHQYARISDMDRPPSSRSSRGWQAISWCYAAKPLPPTPSPTWGLPVQPPRY